MKSSSMMSRLLIASAMASLFMKPTDGEASENPNAKLAADTAALETAKQAVADDTAKLATDTAALNSAQAVVDADTAAVEANAAEIATHPVVGVLEQIEEMVSTSFTAVADSVRSDLSALFAKAKSLIDAPLVAEAPAPTAVPAAPAETGATAVENTTSSQAAAS